MLIVEYKFFYQKEFKCRQKISNVSINMTSRSKCRCERD